eukprot:GCRY01003405.1.p1 GENE.GCRY01003405.1~~GCRY01003405.1.p1  ORF type:complete len:327 (+),score=77.39 GCRY01003405.1:122-1102(+)
MAELPINYMKLDIEDVKKANLLKHFETSETEYERLEINHPLSDAKLTVQLNGACITSWKPADEAENVFFVSKKAVKNQLKKSVRGGVPLVFPQFGPGPLPQHGFARTSKWILKEAFHQNEHKQQDDGHAVPPHTTVVLQLSQSADTLELWPHDFELCYVISLFETSLLCRLSVANTGSEPFAFQALLHNYFAVAALSDAAVHLPSAQALPCYDKVTQTDTVLPVTQPGLIEVGFDGSEKDCVAKGASSQTVIHTGKGHNIQMTTTHFPDLVLWNIGGEKVKGMADMDDSEYEQYICAEPGHVGSHVTLRPGQAWYGQMLLTATPDV